MMLQHSKVPMFKMNPFYSSQLSASGTERENTDLARGEERKRSKKKTGRETKEQNEKSARTKNNNWQQVVSWTDPANADVAMAPISNNLLKYIRITMLHSKRTTTCLGYSYFLLNDKVCLVLSG